MNRINIIQELKPLTMDKINKDFYKLRDIAMLDDFSQKLNCKVGNNTVDYFTFEERLDTIGNKGINFYQFMERLPETFFLSCFINMILYIPKEYKEAPYNMY
jgi:hypothetical protein